MSIVPLEGLPFADHHPCLEMLIHDPSLAKEVGYSLYAAECVGSAEETDLGGWHRLIN